MKAPKDRNKNLLYRLEIMEKAEGDEVLQADLIARCMEDPIFCIDSFFWTYDPREANPHLPFILYPKQEELVLYLDDALERSKNGYEINVALDKPRAVGASYTVIAWMLTRWLKGNFSGRLGSRVQDYVDKPGEPDALFYKLDYMLKRLPPWLVPEHRRASMMLENKTDEGTQISGESANPNFGRGGRKACIVFDELGFWNWARSSWESAGESTNLRIAMSTPPEAGRDSHFAKLIEGKRGNIEVFNFEWYDVPTRDENWLEQKRANKSAEEFAREVMKSYEGTTEGKVYASELKRAVINDEIEFNPKLPLFCAWDFGRDQVAIIWMQKDFATDKLYIIDSYHNTNKPVDFYVPFITGQIVSGVYEYDNADLEKIGLHLLWTKEITHYGDPDVNHRRVADDTTTNSVLQKHGIYVQSEPWAGRTWYADMREKTAMAFRRLHINESRNEYLISALRGARYPKLKENSQATSEPIKPVHDWTSHFRTAFEYFVDNEPKRNIFSDEYKRRKLAQQQMSKPAFNKYSAI